MKKLLQFFVFVFILLTSTLTYSQLTCGDLFTDSGNADGNYQPNENITTVICPTNPGEAVTVFFTAFAIENNFDYLQVYDGPNASSQLLANLTGSISPTAFTASNPSGCLTFVFTSDNSVHLPGWIAEIMCAPLSFCPTPTGLILSSITSIDAQLTWTESGTSTLWEVLVLPAGSPSPSPTASGTPTSSNPFLLTGLVAGNPYNVYVRSVCSSNENSNWSIPASFTAPLCSAPDQISVSNISETSAVFSWQNTSGIPPWQVAVVPATNTIPPTNGDMVTINTNYTVNGLIPGTAYYFYVQASCGNGAMGAWSSPFLFTTSSLPVECGGMFADNGGSTGNYLNNSDSTVTICPDNPGDFVTVTFASFSTENQFDGLYVYNGNSTASAQIMSTNDGGNVPGGLPGSFWGSTIPGPFTSTDASGCLTFRFISDGSVTLTGWVADVQCGLPPTCPRPTNVSVQATSFSTATIGWVEAGSATEWEVQLTNGANTTTTNTNANPFLVSNLIEGEVYIVTVRAICAPSDISNWSIPFTFLMPSCQTPTNISANSITPNSATINWANQGTSNQWEVLVVPAGSPAPTASSTGTNATTTSLSINGLTSFTTYDVYVRALCGFNYVSDWSVVYTFTTSQYLAPLTASTTQYTTEQLVTNLLVNNPCVTISNVTSSTGTNFGSTNGIGSFVNTNPSFPISHGIVLSTGNAISVSGPNTTTVSEGSSNWPGDPDLESIVTIATGQVMNGKNATTLEFDFTSLNEFMSFNFLFASEEYGTFQCSFSDAFAFLLTDEITGITTNLAVVPGTNVPVSVVTIRNDLYNSGCPSANPAYFGAYNDEFASATNFNGQTVLMTASSTLIPNHPYHIKLVVADRQDTLLDSAVFIEAGAFAVGPPQCNDKINLVAFVDANNNGVKDSGENDFSYGAFIVEENNSGVQNYVTSPIGTYTIFDSNPVNVYDFNYQINNEFAPYYSLAATSFNDINIPLGSGTQTFYFPLTLTQGFNDVTVSISPLSQPRPGFNYTNRVTYKNLGVVATSGTLNFVKDPVTTIVSVSPSGTISTATGFTYDFVNLQPYESRSFNVTMSVPDVPTVNLDDLLTTSASVSAPANDISLENNSFTNTQVVVASYDPNDITEAHGEKIQFNQFSSNDYLYYTIRFQNTGTANAINVRLENTLDAQLDESSIRMVSASHNYVMERINNQLVWKFDYINLVSNLQSEELSKGYVTYKIKVQPGFAIGDIIPNTAEIYFDNNAAIVTNTFNTEFVASLGNASFESTDLLIFPNPANTTIQIQLQNTSEMIDLITITDVLGKNIRNVKGVSSNQLSVDVADLSQGVYFVEISTQNNLKQVKKLIKE